MAANRMLSYSRAVLRKKQQIWYETRMWNSTFSNQKEETIHRQQNMTAEASGWMKICAALLFASEFVSCGSRHRDGATVGLNWKKVHQIMRTNKISYNFRIPYEIFQIPTAAVRVYFSTNMWLQECLKARIKVFRKTQLFEANRAWNFPKFHFLIIFAHCVVVH